MSKVCVVTGGGSGMGLEAAKVLGKERIVVISGRTEKKLQQACETLKECGCDAHYFVCDTSKRDSVKQLVEFACSLGEVTNVVNSAGLSPNMSDPETILRVNALGTVYINEEFSKVMQPNTVILDVASNSAYVLPSFLINKKIYLLADQDEDLFVTKMLKKAKMAKEGYQRSGLAYSLSKNFVVWYAKKCAYEYGPKGIRVVSLSPGLIATDMGNLEKSEGGYLVPLTAENRMGKPEELGYAIATVADERNGYLTAVDVLCDGGATNRKEFKK
ncbi:MAG: SDR family NAD(P)-dependent oxidoreductase [Erysipelotrichaceae bacterium]